jgi:hypothetical protein
VSPTTELPVQVEASAIIASSAEALFDVSEPVRRNADSGRDEADSYAREN